MDTQLNALPILAVRARTVSGCLNSAFLDISQHFTSHLFRPWIPSSTRCQHFPSALGPFSGCLNSAFLGLERNRSAVGKTKAPLVAGGPQQLAPPTPYSPLPFNPGGRAAAGDGRDDRHSEPAGIADHRHPASR